MGESVVPVSSAGHPRPAAAASSFSLFQELPLTFGTSIRVVGHTDVALTRTRSMDYPIHEPAFSSFDLASRGSPSRPRSGLLALFFCFGSRTKIQNSRGNSKKRLPIVANRLVD